MKIITSKDSKNGRTKIVTVEIDANEKLVAIDPNAYYKLGQPMDDEVFGGYILAEVHRCSWCSIEQKWVE